MSKDIVLIGGGGHAKVIIDIIRTSKEYNIIGICDLGDKGIGDIPLLGSDEVLPRVYGQGVSYAFVCIGAINAPDKRWKLYKQLKQIGYTLPVLKHYTAIVSPSAVIEEGTCVMPGAVINADTEIGAMTIINTASIIEHDCKVGSNAHISPGACLCGSVTIGNHTHVGAKSVINPQISIGSYVTIGSGSVVVSDIEDKLKVLGVPAKVY